MKSNVWTKLHNDCKHLNKIDFSGRFQHKNNRRIGHQRSVFDTCTYHFNFCLQKAGQVPRKWTPKAACDGFQHRAKRHWKSSRQEIHFCILQPFGIFAVSQPWTWKMGPQLYIDIFRPQPWVSSTKNH